MPVRSLLRKGLVMIPVHSFDMSSPNPIKHWRERGSRVLHALVDAPLQGLLGRQHRAQHQPGAGPGVLFISPDAVPTSVCLVRIDGQELERIDQPSLAEVKAARERGGRLWLDVSGFADDGQLREIGELFQLHPLTLADVVNVDRQTKVDALEDGALIITQVLQLGSPQEDPGVVQLGLVMMDGVLLSFRERHGPLFEPVLERMERSTSRLRTEDLDYLAQALLDVAVDAAFPVVEVLAERIDAIEDDIMAGKGQGLLIEIHRQRRALITLGRLLWRQRDLMARLLRDEQVFRRQTQMYLRDVYDRTVQLLDMVETTRELAASLLEIHLSISANRSNQIMKTLTIMASIFIPLTFIAGVYGMNFEWMPELGWKAGYPAALLLMLGVAVVLLLWFRQRGWLQDER